MHLPAASAGVKRTGGAFRTHLAPREGKLQRWPQPLPTLRTAPAATMGYKGIITSYLPRNHTVTRAVVLPHGRCGEEHFW